MYLVRQVAHRQHRHGSQSLDGIARGRRAAGAGQDAVEFIKQIRLAEGPRAERLDEWRRRVLSPPGRFTLCQAWPF